MRYLGCNSCLTVINLYGDPLEMEKLIFSNRLWAEGWPCVTDGCPGPMETLPQKLVDGIPNAVQQGLMKMHQLTAQELFQAFLGYGLPDELGTEPEVVSALLLSSSIVSLRTRRSPSGRTVLDRIDLENGLSVHLASSGHGPTVIKVTRRRHDSDDDLNSVLQGSTGASVHDEAQRGSDLSLREGHGSDVLREDKCRPDANAGTYQRVPQAIAEVPRCEGDDVAEADEVS